MRSGGEDRHVGAVRDAPWIAPDRRRLLLEHEPHMSVRDLAIATGRTPHAANQWVSYRRRTRQILVVKDDGVVHLPRFQFTRTWTVRHEVVERLRSWPEPLDPWAVWASFVLCDERRMTR